MVSFCSQSSHRLTEELVQRPRPPLKVLNISLFAPKATGQDKQAPSATWLREQQVGSASDGNNPKAKRAPLTRKNLALFNKMAEKKDTGKSALSASPDPTRRTRTTTISTTAPGFSSRARDNGILNPRNCKAPTNLDNLREQYAESRYSASPTESAFKDYIDEVEDAPNEATMVEVGGQLLKKYPRDGYKRVLNQAFTGFPKNVGFNNGLSAPQPDYAQGLEKDKFRPFPIYQIDGAIIYKDDPDSLTLPHLAGEWKGPGKDMREARLQSAYDGASLVYARNKALSYLGTPDPPGYAQITTFTTDGTNLNLFAHYARPSSIDGRLEYHQYPINSTLLTNSYQEFKTGRKELRNAQDYAKNQCYNLRDQLNDYWQKQQHCDALQAIAEGASRPGLCRE
ncbi:hypothetical protein M406DRAFT_251172 [Cryphonectria parasitica EP155]|uniref:DUF7924 domain-containing protein n=1 Tax=Cryphonectria parasitica (strain ATCC 38755 / EP155) TaxID=660469 RepID=A0A9P4Y7A1_CRYP1|nr:uncharacterized protein M406DRAFT_251172 [Cryphonectria parasitica EP155]KAF3768264.1 hypothetical protein M406DRAFT_251172 [Cryphonectria parasitica EP155]